MTSFDYLHAKRPQSLWQMLERLIPQECIAPWFGVTAALVVVACAWAIQAHRLDRALRAEAAYETRYESAERQVRIANRAAARRIAIDRMGLRLQAIAGSGYGEARRLAEIANNIPQHAWITTIARRRSGYYVEGGADNLSRVGALLAALMHARYVREPMLVSVTSAGSGSGDFRVKYGLRLETAQ